MNYKTYDFFLWLSTVKYYTTKKHNILHNTFMQDDLKKFIFMNKLCHTT